VAVLSIVTVVSVYAVWIGAFQGGEVTVGTAESGSVKYSLTNVEGATWASSLENPTSASWYSRLEFLADGYSGPVSITWKLQKKTGTSWDNITSTLTPVTLTGAAQNIYVTGDGLIDGNRDWELLGVTGSGTYRVIVEINSV
jgi:hypothetical protein